MHIWKDSMGQPWVLSLTPSKFEVIAGETGIDLAALCRDDHGDGLRELLDDNVRLAKVLYACSHDVTRHYHVDYADFASMLHGGDLRAARAAFINELEFASRNGLFPIAEPKVDARLALDTYLRRVGF